MIPIVACLYLIVPCSNLSVNSLPPTQESFIALLYLKVIFSGTQLLDVPYIRLLTCIVHQGIVARTFKKRNSNTSESDRSVWTDTPADRERKLKVRTRFLISSYVLLDQYLRVESKYYDI